MNLIRKALTFGVVLLFFGISIYPFSVSLSAKQPPTSIVTHASPQNSFSNDTEYYAVICACSEYKNPKYDLPRHNPAPESKLRVLYDTLMQTKNWQADHVILLLNQNATKANITQALVGMAATVGPDDIFLFSWNGHGTEVPDVDGNTTHRNSNDSMEVAICPYDTEKVNGSLTNVLTADELGTYFSAIKAKGKCLVFESCLSGGLVDATNATHAGISDQLGAVDASSFTTDFQYDLKHPRGCDVNGNNTVVIMSTLPTTLGLAVPPTHCPLLYSMAAAINHSSKTDTNHDGCLSAEEIFAKARGEEMVLSSGLWMMMFGSAYLFFKFNLYKVYPLPPIMAKIYKLIDRLSPITVLTAAFITILYYLDEQFIEVLLNGHFFLNWPNMLDQYPGELPLVTL